MSLKRSLLVTGTVSLCTLIVAVIIGTTHEWEWPAHVNEEELLGAGLLVTTEPDIDTAEVARAKEDTEPAIVDGKAATAHRGWYINGKKEYEHTYAANKQHGRQRNWDPTGQLICEQHWTEGYLHGRSTRWYSNGQLAEEGEYADARPEGTHRTWYRNGQPYTSVEYRDGLRYGRFAAWHPNGQRNCEASFRNDKLDGPWQTWDTDGVLLRRLEYKHGRIVLEWPKEHHQPGTYPGVLGSPDFAFVLRQGGGLTGFHTLRVSAAGRCDFTYYSVEQHVTKDAGARQRMPRGSISRAVVWRRAEFWLNADVQRQLRDAITTARVLSLRSEYVDTSIADGTQWTVGVRAAGEEEHVFCDNRFPTVLVQLSRTIRDQILVPHRMEVLTASRIDTGEQAAGWLEDAGR